MKTTQIALASWAGLLASTVSEAGLDVDFPLTPTIWLVIAVFGLLFAAAHSTIGRSATPHQFIITANTRTKNCASTVLLKKARTQVSGPTRHADPWAFVAGRVTARGDSCFGGGIVTASDALLAANFLSPAATRGPPWNDNQIAGTLGRPARHLYAAPPLFARLFPSSSSSDLNPTNGESA